MAGALTAQQAQDILNSAQVFQDGVNSMNQVYNEVFSASDQLKGLAINASADCQPQLLVESRERQFLSHGEVKICSIVS